MRGIESAFFGVLGKDPELKTSKSGAAYATLAVVVGEDADSQWVRVACFGETAEQIAIRAKKGDKVYVEGTLTLNTWTDKTTGEERHGLNVAAWRVDKLANIGKARVWPEKGEAQAQLQLGTSPRGAALAETPPKSLDEVRSQLAGKDVAKTEAPVAPTGKASSAIDPNFNDELTFAPEFR